MHLEVKGFNMCTNDEKVVEIGDHSVEEIMNDYSEYDNAEKSGTNLDESYHHGKNDTCHRIDNLESIKGKLSSLEEYTRQKYSKLDAKLQALEERTSLVQELYSKVEFIAGKVGLEQGVSLDDPSTRIGNPSLHDNMRLMPVIAGKLDEIIESLTRKKRLLASDERPCSSLETNKSRRTYCSEGKSDNISLSRKKDNAHGPCFSQTSKCNQSYNNQGMMKSENVIDLSSPTLVEKVKNRTDRQRSKIFMSPFEGLKYKKKVLTNFDDTHIDDITRDLDLSELEVASIKFVLREMVLDLEKALVCMGPAELENVLDCTVSTKLTGTSMRSLVRPVKETGLAKWLVDEIINSYANILNSSWAQLECKEVKYAISTLQSQWLGSIGKEWQKFGRYCRKRSGNALSFCQTLVQAEMVFVPINTCNNHWWLGVLNQYKLEFQIIDSLNRRLDYAKETIFLRSGIHSMLQEFSSQLLSKWTNFDILNWDVVVIKNVPRQYDSCSCGIFTIKYMQHWNGSELTSTFSQKHMETFRKKMPAELLLSPLNNMTSVKEDVRRMASA